MRIVHFGPIHPGVTTACDLLERAPTARLIKNVTCLDCVGVMGRAAATRASEIQALEARRDARG